MPTYITTSVGLQCTSGLLNRPIIIIIIVFAERMEDIAYTAKQ